MATIILNNRTIASVTQEEINLLTFLTGRKLRYGNKPIYSIEYAQHVTELLNLVQNGVLAGYVEHTGQDFNPEIVIHPFIFAATCRDFYRMAEWKAMVAMNQLLSNGNKYVDPNDFKQSREYRAFAGKSNAYPDTIHSKLKPIPIHSYENPVSMETICNPEEFTGILNLEFRKSETRLEL